ncbi:polysaccharide lyase 8 family protein [Streptomyces sp. NPDC058953]|uniref:polysaccharide lyase 8 family protein n=1 Tax=unclassified Streptomyces TaxID=2593676 RepID=UPI0036A86CCA
MSHPPAHPSAHPPACPPARPADWSRRTFAAACTAALPLALGGPARAQTGGAGPRPCREPGDPYGLLRRRWLEIALGDGYDPAAEPYASRLAEIDRLAAAHRAAMTPAADSLWPDLPLIRPAPPAGITRSYARLWTMARAYVYRGGTDPGPLADVLRGLDHIGALVYHPGTTVWGNWWEWRIGSPRLLMDLVAVLHDQLGAERRDAACAAVDHFVPDALLGDYSGVSTGANRVDLCRSVALRGVAGRSAAKLALARDALSPVFPHVTEGDGLYADGSFVQHTRVAYTGTYGQVFLDGLGRLLALLGGSPWEVTDPARHTVADSVERAFAPLIHNGLIMDSVSGRAVSRGLLKDDDRRVLRGDHYHGRAVIASIALLAGTVPAARRDRWHALIKGWAARDTTGSLLTAPQHGVAELARLAAAAAAPVPAAPRPVGHTLFTAMDRAVHRRPGWTANIAMASDRTAYYECGNGEHPRGWHTGAGMLLWWPEHTLGDQYDDWFWPTVDPYRMPGTTVSTKRLADNEGGEWGEPRPAVRWVGGVTDGTYAAVGQHLRGLGSTLTARKSWFCADDAVICLGAGITCTDGVPVETVVDNRNLGGNGRARLRYGARWAHLEGHGGWVLPGGTHLLHGRREDRTGAWADINTGGTAERATRRYQTLWLDHGTDPVDASYVYLLMPGASAAEVAARAADPARLTVLANDAGRQAVTLPAIGVTAANFWRAGTAGPLTASGPVSVLVRRRGQGRTADLRLADPERSGRPVEVEWRHPVRRVDDHDPGITVLATGGSIRLRLNGGTAGAGHRCRVTLG